MGWATVEAVEEPLHGFRSMKLMVGKLCGDTFAAKLKLNHRAKKSYDLQSNINFICEFMGLARAWTS